MKTLADFPTPETLKRRMQSLAMLDALLCPDWEPRYFCFTRHWDAGEAMGSVRNGSGDELFALFTPAGCFIKECNQGRPALGAPYAGVPLAFRDATRDPAFSPDQVTACYWHEGQAGRWDMNGPDGVFDPEGSFLLAMIDGCPETYEAFAREYFEFDLPSGLANLVFNHQALDTTNLDGFGLSGELEDLTAQADEIGYPLA